LHAFVTAGYEKILIYRWQNGQHSPTTYFSWRFQQKKASKKTSRGGKFETGNI